MEHMHHLLDRYSVITVSIQAIDTPIEFQYLNCLTEEDTKQIVKSYTVLDFFL
jgi:hypothetical protein